MKRQTSIQAYNDIKPQLGQRQQQIYDAIKKFGCPTNLELSKWLGIPINQVTPRTNELVKLGKVVEHEKRECSVSHRQALTWRINQ